MNSHKILSLNAVFPKAVKQSSFNLNGGTKNSIVMQLPVEVWRFKEGMSENPNCAV